MTITSNAGSASRAPAALDRKAPRSFLNCSGFAAGSIARTSMICHGRNVVRVATMDVPVHANARGSGSVGKAR